MTPLARKFAALGLAAVFFFSAMTCCCLKDVFAAKEEVPACHQADHANSSRHDPANCLCEHTFATVNAPVDFTGPAAETKFLSVVDLFPEPVPVFDAVDAYQAPPPAEDISPLYIKHSILRI